MAITAEDVGELKNLIEIPRENSDVTKESVKALDGAQSTARQAPFDGMLVRCLRFSRS